MRLVSGNAIGVCVMLACFAVSAQEVRKQAPIFEVDPFWPKPLPNHWVTGSTIGLSVDAQDRVWTIHRPGSVEDNLKAADIKAGNLPLGECCKVAPPVLVYDQAGNLVKSWGGPGQGYDWPESNHGITVDHKGNVWLAGNGTKDTQVLKFDGDGKFLMQLGKHGRSQRQPTDIEKLSGQPDERIFPPDSPACPNWKGNYVSSPKRGVYLGKNSRPARGWKIRLGFFRKNGPPGKI